MEQLRETIEHPLAAAHAHQPVMREMYSHSRRRCYHRIIMQGSACSTSATPKVNPSNRLGLDYLEEATKFPRRAKPIIDVHTHLNGAKAVTLYRQAAEAYGVGLTYSMTALDSVNIVRDVMRDRVRFIAVPNWRAEDKKTEFGERQLDTIERFHALGSRICKFWTAPRSIDIATELGDPTYLRLDNPLRIRMMELASSLGMIFMVHVGDPDTWFATKYTNSAVYGTKLQQYEPLEILLDRFTQPWIAAHMAGWPEDLEFLTGLLQRHRNLHLDCSACKWMARELSKHSREELLSFLQRFRGRILFGTDIVTSDEHLKPSDPSVHEVFRKASSIEGAFDLYASRFWAYRTMFETDYNGESPIADPDLEMIDPKRYGPMDAPALRGFSLPDDLLDVLYHDAAQNLLEPLHG